jgi:hypothetical protein
LFLGDDHLLPQNCERTDRESETNRCEGKVLWPVL